MKKFFLVIIVFAGALHACTKKVNEPISPKTGKPGEVTEVSVANLNGGATITYRIPNQAEVISVKAVYTLSNGKQYEALSSMYENKLTLMGYNDENEHEVLLYTVNRAQELSDPVKCTIKPKISPLKLAAATVHVQEDFGGARFSWQNELKSPLAFEMYTPDSLGRMTLVRVINSQVEEGTQALRGYPPVPRVFGLVVKDNFGNRSDTIFPPNRKLTPLFEERLPKNAMSIMRLANDQSFTNWEGSDQKIIDDDLTSFGHSASSSLPAPFTLDLGVTAKVSRFVLFQRKFSDSYYNWGNPRTFDVYVRATAPSQSGDWSEWTKVMEAEVIKPSGASTSTVTDDDLRAAENGHEFTFDLSLEPVRYIRIVVRSTWGSTTFTHPAEVDVYGERK
ncbi:DUF5000 domain-containing lipoprotein [Chitinophaga sp. GCM10012297]|uniref:DUF4959 domain-containing protein n=1 Tax=Chitinophaga chungangae TaxID=2821488 RepID=A0ABS3YA02_9BACT|nr:DUF5000 domain-containing lipoprotein [Chitinophaga chungangae]MBO9151502.1 DUF4959 domain-containing protein [Chitinophaga chungangae]